MNIGSLPVFKVAKEQMNFLSARQTVLAQNVANVDTPGYIGRDLKTPNYKAIAKGMDTSTGLVRTNTMHIPNLSGSGANGYVDDDLIVDERNPDGSRVSLDDQFKRVAETQMQYNIATGVYRKNIALFKMAIGDRSGG